MTTKRDTWKKGLQPPVSKRYVLCGCSSCQKERIGQPAGQDKKWKVGLPGRETGTLGTPRGRHFRQETRRNAGRIAEHMAVGIDGAEATPAVIRLASDWFLCGFKGARIRVVQNLLSTVFTA